MSPLRVPSARLRVYDTTVVASYDLAPDENPPALEGLAAQVWWTCHMMGRPVTVAELAAQVYPESSAPVAVAVAELVEADLLGIRRSGSHLHRIRQGLRGHVQRLPEAATLLLVGPHRTTYPLMRHLCPAPPWRLGSPPTVQALLPVGPDLNLLLVGIEALSPDHAGWYDLSREALGALVVARPDDEHVPERVGPLVDELRTSVLVSGGEVTGELRQRWQVPDSVGLHAADLSGPDGARRALDQVCAHWIEEEQR